MEACKVLVSTNGMSRGEWLEWRKKGIGGSDIPAIAGLVKKYKSAISVYLEKTGQAPSEDGVSESAEWGNRLEPVLAEAFAEKTGWKVQRRNCIYARKDKSYCIANVDRLIFHDEWGIGVLECKTADKYFAELWEEDKVPDAYYLQMQWYLYVLGLNWGYFAYLVGGNRFGMKRVDRDDAIIEELVKMADRFWLEHVEKHQMPAPDGGDDAEEQIKKLYPKADETADAVILDYEEEADLERMQELKQMVDKLEEEMDAIEQRIKLKLGERTLGDGSHYKVTWKGYRSTGFDVAKFKEEYPMLYKQYVKDNYYRRFNVKKVK